MNFDKLQRVDGPHAHRGNPEPVGIRQDLPNTMPQPSRPGPKSAVSNRSSEGASSNRMKATPSATRRSARSLMNARTPVGEQTPMNPDLEIVQEYRQREVELFSPEPHSKNPFRFLPVCSTDIEIVESGLEDLEEFDPIRFQMWSADLMQRVKERKKYASQKQEIQRHLASSSALD